MSFKTEVEDITLEVNDTTALDQWLKDGAWDIINRVKLTDPSKLQSFSKFKLLQELMPTKQKVKCL